VALGIYFVVLPVVMQKTVFKSYYAAAGPVRYHVMAQLLLWFGLVPIKMLLRWTVNLKYIVGIPEWFFNV
jgi:hypothetical protein